MTFVYCNVARLLYTRGQSHKQGALRKQSAQPGYSPDERAHRRGWNTNRNWNSTNTVVQAMPNGLQSVREAAFARSQPRYIPCTDLRYRLLTSTTRRQSTSRRCAYQGVYRISPIETKARSTSGISYFLHCRLQVSDILHPILQSVPYHDI
ncbi:unnamed protein product [Lasius platythorax]|uniref:Uncharacterized protein n=1 Tax=Lasius platythorax TaxID=488582 RepID=A0AAV2NXW8_9HYME